MRKVTRFFLAVAFTGALGAAAGCGDSDSSDTGMSSTGSTTAADTLYARLGGNAGIKTVVGNFVGRVLADPKINGFFLNASVDGGHLVDCLVKQIGEATGGPEKYDCKSMKEAHAGMGISTEDFNDLAGHLVDELTAAKVAQADIDTIVGVLGPMAGDIVENPKGDETIYLRFGRKPGVQAAIEGFVGKVAANAEINGFFGDASVLPRLETCLVRQVCSATGGPCKYGAEVDAGDAEPGVSAAKPCRDMKTTHSGLKDGEGSGITIEDFNALAGELVAELTELQVAQADIDAVVGVLGPMCKDIVATPEDCP